MAKATILIIEDDPDIRELLSFSLAKEGWSIVMTSDGEAGIAALPSANPDCVVLDIMLPGMDGLEVLRALKSDPGRKRLPVIMTTAKGEESDVVTGLELGAEDYVAKPFSLAELLARVRAALRRGHAPAAERRRVILFGEVEVDVEARNVKRRGEPVEMTAREFDVLVCLINERGRVLSRDDIFRRVWGPKHHGTPRTVDNFIQQLRAKLETDPQEPAHIQTVRGVGYRFDG